MYQQTVVAAFERPNKAHEALNALLDEGFPRERAHVGSAEDLDPNLLSDRDEGKHETLGEKIAYFFGLGDDADDTASTYSEVLRRGNSVVVVDAAGEEEVQRAASILNRYDPIDIDARLSEWQGSGRRETPSAQAEAKIPVVEERLQVGKREVQGGGVRVFSRTTDVPVEQRVTLREERATITRRPTDRPVTDSDRPFESKSIDVMETREEAVVGKTARVVEEVVVGKEARTREETIQDRVRKTDVQVERLDKQSDATPRPKGSDRQGR
jgi:uncharacterized protein (TIGR02271 family)